MPVEPERVATMVSAICRLERIGRVNDRAAAVFFGDAHTTLHELASMVEPVDRAITARLLEAKAAVEGPLTSGRPVDDFGSDVRRLGDAADRARTRVGLGGGGCRS